MIQEVAGGEITSDLIDIYPKKIEDFKVVLNFEKVNKVIDEELKKETIKNILASLDIKINSISDAGLGLNIPSYRVDVQREVDVIEEILRVYGYNNIKIPSKINASVSNSSRTEEFKVQNVIANQLCSLGFNEMMANSLTTSNYVCQRHWRRGRRFALRRPWPRPRGCEARHVHNSPVGEQATRGEVVTAQVPVVGASSAAVGAFSCRSSTADAQVGVPAVAPLVACLMAANSGLAVAPGMPVALAGWAECQPSSGSRCSLRGSGPCRRLRLVLNLPP